MKASTIKWAVKLLKAVVIQIVVEDIQNNGKIAQAMKSESGCKCDKGGC